MQYWVDRGVRLTSSGIPRRVTQSYSKATRRRFVHSSSKFAKESPRRLRRSLIIAAPVAGVAALYLTPTEISPVPVILSSPKVIPCTSSPGEDVSCNTHQMSSPHEKCQSIRHKILLFIKVNICEPILTAGRFIHLTILFVPVLLVTPIILFGPRRGRHNERFGALMWYAFLTRQMQRAGPTFIKVRTHIPSFGRISSPTLARPMGCFAAGSLPRRDVRTTWSTSLRSQTPPIPAHQAHNRNRIQTAL